MRRAPPMKGNLFMLGWRALSSTQRRSLVQYCVDMAEAKRIAAGLVKFDGGGRWRVYGLTRVQSPDSPVRLGRGDLLARGETQGPGPRGREIANLISPGTTPRRCPTSSSTCSRRTTSRG